MYVMDWVQVFIGLLAGFSYSILGWLKNKSQCSVETIEPKKIAETLLNIRKDWEKIDEIAKTLSRTIWENIYCKKFYFDHVELLTTLIQGLVIGFFIGFIELPLDTATSLTSQIGILTMLRKTIKIIKHTVKPSTNISLK
ncbi:MAG: hypothetical protein RMI88_04615 [Nitrososphaerota archaeon]|nr:hypothetical protein [Nitrososphaerota archaeon]